LAQIRPVFQDPHVMREVTGLPLLGTVSRTTKIHDLSGARIGNALFVVAGCALVVIAKVLLMVDVRALLGLAS
jgi:hypothetical protein